MTTAESLVIMPQEIFSAPVKRRFVNCSASDNETKLKSCHTNCKLLPNLLSCSLSELRQNGRIIVAPSLEIISSESSVSRMARENDMWKCIRTNYLYLMGNDLVRTCKKTREELLLADVPSAALTCTQFIDRFNMLHDALHAIQVSASIQNDKNNFLKSVHSKLRVLWNECQTLKEQSKLLEVRYPEMTDDINRRCNLLNNKWKALEMSIAPKAQQQNRSELPLRDVSPRIKQFRRWLREVKTKLKELNTMDRTCPSKMEEVLGCRKVLQSEIENRGKEVTSLLREASASVEGAAVERNRAVSSVRSLERSWHALWLRSLEDLCLSEQLLDNNKSDSQSNQYLDSSDTDLDEAPRKKYRRLTYDSRLLQKTFSPMENSETPGSSSSSSFTKVSSSKHEKIVSRTQEIGIHRTEQRQIISRNDKCIMVGTTGIDALKAKFGDDFTNFEVIQDVGYSSESSTHLSSDDVSDKIRVYSFSPPRKMETLMTAMSVKREVKKEVKTHFTKVVEVTRTSQKTFDHSSLGSSSSASHNDSGFGAMDTSLLCDKDIIKEIDVCEEGLSESDLEVAMNRKLEFPECNDETVDVKAFAFDGFETDESLGDINSRLSLTSDAQAFYKMTSVESETGDMSSDVESIPRITGPPPSLTAEAFPNLSHSYIDFIDEAPEECTAAESKRSVQETKEVSIKQNGDTTMTSTLRTKMFKESRNPSWESQVSDGFVLEMKPERTSTPANFPSEYCGVGDTSSSPEYIGSSEVREGHKKDEDEDSSQAEESSHSSSQYPRSRRVREWLNHLDGSSNTCSRSHGSENESHDEEDSCHRHPVPIDTALDSSCDASYEYTTTAESDIDGSVLSSTEDNGGSSIKESGMGSAKTVISTSASGGHHKTVNLESSQYSELLLPPPPTSTAPSSDESDFLNTDPDVTPTRRRSTVKASDTGRNASVEDIKNSSSTLEDYNCHSNQRPLSFEQVCRKRLDSSSGTKTGYSHMNRQTRSLPNILKSDSFQSSSNSDHRHSFPSCSDDIPRKGESVSCKRRTRRKITRSSRSKKTQVVINHETSTRKRHWSQVQTPGMLTQSSEVKLLDGIESSSALCRSKAVVSPDSDVILNSVENQSTVSDQVWDGYQELPYLSEAYSEPRVDEDAVRKLTEFGDDYGFAIGQTKAYRIYPKPRSYNTSTSKNSTTMSQLDEIGMASPNVMDSDSDMEVLYDVLDDAYQALYFAMSTFENQSSLSDTGYVELLATCQTHLQCLQTISECIEADGKCRNFTERDVDELHGLIKQWENFKETIEMMQKTKSVQAEMEIVREKMNQIDFQCKMNLKDVTSYEDLRERLEIIQMALSSLQIVKDEDLMQVNLHTHRLATMNFGDDTTMALKDDIKRLYDLWQLLYEKNGQLSSHFHAVLTKWEEYRTKLTILLKDVEDLKCTAHDSRDARKQIHEKDLELNKLWWNYGNLLQNDLNEDLWLTISHDFQKARTVVFQTAKDLKCYELSFPGIQKNTSRSSYHPTPSMLVEDTEDETSVDATTERPLLRNRRETPQLVTAPIAAIGKKKSPSTPSKLWRIFRASLPIQLALALLYCFASAWEPHCCNFMNNMSYSLLPQLRHIKGPPPV